MYFIHVLLYRISEKSQYLCLLTMWICMCMVCVVIHCETLNVVCGTTVSIFMYLLTLHVACTYCSIW